MPRGGYTHGKRRDDKSKAAMLSDLLHLKFTSRKLTGKDVRTMQSFHQMFFEQLYDLEAQERFIMGCLANIEKQKAAIVPST
jgi:hypothetical protein